jgi:hypothetical protein
MYLELKVSFAASSWYSQSDRRHDWRIQGDREYRWCESFAVELHRAWIFLRARQRRWRQKVEASNT